MICMYVCIYIHTYIHIHIRMYVPGCGRLQAMQMSIGSSGMWCLRMWGFIVNTIHYYSYH